MATLDELSRALVAADKAGDVQAAKILAGEITKMRAQPAPMNVDPTEGMSDFDKFFAGMGKAVTDTARGVGQLVGAVSRQDVAESRKRDAALMNTRAGMAGNIVGNVAPMVAAAPFMPAAATIRGGMAVGSLMGMLQPSTSTGETVGNTVLGGVAGAAVPAAVTAYRAAKSAAEPFYESGRQAIVGRALNRAAGADAPAVAQRLKEAGTPFVGPSQGTPRTVMGELVPGSMPTVGQAAQNPGVAALERAAVASNPEMTNAVSAQMQAQNAARVGVLQDMAGTDGARLFASEARDATANEFYKNAYERGIDITRDAVSGQFKSKAQIAGVKGEITKLMQRPAIQDAVKEARRLAANEGVSMKDMTGSVKGLDYLKRALDDQIGQAAGNEKRILVDLKSRLLTTIDGLSPDYQAARQTFAEMSRPINQMDVAQAIADKSVNKLTGNLQPAAFARALSDQTAAGATGLRSATLEGTLSNAQRNRLHEVLSDLQRANAAQNAGRGPGSDTVQKLAYTNMLDQAGVPTFMRNFAPAQIVGNLGSRAADLAYGRANREISNRLAEVMLDPEQAAQLMLTAGPAGQNALLLMLQRGASGGAAMSAPALANAQK